MSGTRKDLPPVSANNFLNRVREVLQGYLGSNGDYLNRGLTVRDLADAGLVRVNPTYLQSGVGTPVIGVGSAVGSGGGSTTVVVPGGPSEPAYVPDYTQPPAPTGFFCGAGLSHLQGGIDEPAYTVGHGHAYSILYGATYGGTGPLPFRSDAVELMRFNGKVFAYPTNPATTWHLWVTHVSKDGIESPPTSGSNGLAVTTGQDATLLLATLSGEIDSSAFTTALQDQLTYTDQTAAEAYDTANTAYGTTQWLSGGYTVRTSLAMDGRRVVSGFGVVGNGPVTQGSTIDFGVAADRFWIAAPQIEGVSGVGSIKPFVVQTSDITTSGGVLIPKGVYMDAAYIKNLEALVARLGTAWIGTAMIADAQIVDAHIDSLDAAKITTGQITAARIDGRGLLIANELGETLLDARGSQVAPWVVNVDNEYDPGAISLALPKDTTNRSTIRSLVVDGVNLSAGYSPSGRSIVLNSTHREVWSVVYGGDQPVYTADGRLPVWEGYFSMEPNTAYTFVFEPRSARVDTTNTGVTMRLYLRVPAGTSGEIPGGAAFSAPAGNDILFANLTSVPLPPSLSTTPQLKLLVVSGPDGGTVQLLAEAASVNQRLCKGSHFYALRNRGYTVPIGTAVRVGQVAAISAGSTRFANTLVSVVTDQPHQGVMNLVWSRSLQRAYQDKPGYISFTAKIINEASTQSRVVVVYGGHISYAPVQPHTVPGLNSNLSFPVAYDLVTGVTFDEVSRWTFHMKLDVLASSWASQVGSSEELVISAPPSEVGAVDYANLSMSADQGTRTPGAFGTVPISTEAPVDGTAQYRFTIQPRFMGIAVDAPQVFLVNLTVTP